MRHFIFAVLLSVGLYAPAHAQGTEIETNIRAQIEAFQADDFDSAFSYASPTIQQVFRSPENFGAMVKNGYPMVWRPAELRFLDLRDVAGQLWQKVMITDAKGHVHVLDYQMVNLEGIWKINAVQVLEAPGIAA
ncbi:DUF4864 domain-containing protein [Phaeobacter gallaeciensis]|uniref:DUF4864 domain-containing protein n=2 Tax=Roseobacteraceae TaxID=2854170 RepID=A0A366WNC6_9RHOB|nr:MULTISPECIES: DUF4864 domain-containing protein [Roseobacteraceae]MBT3141601.1 DUF4864 domain-containing protein [Falsiruegeria litorea]MBT8167258.1 DUF4864 domain-containing protein [Falsiruegeria litorea]RBW50833.1 DUF4864 domain-containing protein [Phaeobacter gallaeciensis]